MLHGLLFGSRGPSEFISATPNALTEKGSGDYFPHRFLYLMCKETTKFGIICYSYITALKQNTHNQPKWCHFPIQSFLFNLTLSLKFTPEGAFAMNIPLNFIFSPLRRTKGSGERLIVPTCTGEILSVSVQAKPKTNQHHFGKSCKKYLLVVPVKLWGNRSPYRSFSKRWHQLQKPGWREQRFAWKSWSS